MRSWIISLTAVLVVSMAHTAFAEGTLRFEWAGEECWDVYRGNVLVAEGCGTDQVRLEPGIYTIKPDGQRVPRRASFGPFEVRISEGVATTVRRGGLLKVRLRDVGCWRIESRGLHVADGCDSDAFGLDEGSYTLSLGRPGADVPMPFDIHTGRVTTLGR